MADFALALAKVLDAEGGLSNQHADKGGLTYKGIARKFYPTWAGWKFVDAGQPVPDQLVVDLYREEFWMPIRGAAIVRQPVAEALFSYSVNAGVKPAVKLAQQACSVTADGIVGNVTLYALNSADPDHFLARFALARIKHRVEVCTRDRSQMVFLLGWLNRDLKEGGI